MINGYKVAALCVSEIQNENTQSMIDPLYQSLLEKNWRCLLFNTTTDLFRDTAFDRGEASIFQLMDFSVIDVVLIYTQSRFGNTGNDFSGRAERARRSV